MKRTVLGASALAFTLVAAGCYEEPPTDPGATTTTTTPDTRVGRFVATTGADAGDCSVATDPCATINFAVGQASDGETVWVEAGTYPEIVSVTKPLTFSGPNAGIGAGVAAGVRGPEAVVKAFRSPGPHHPSSEYEFNVTIDGFSLDPQGDASLLTPDTYHSIALFGGTDVKVVNNVLTGGTYTPTCSYTCTDMMDGAIGIFSGSYLVSNNLVQNYRRPMDVLQQSPLKPVVDAQFTLNTVKNFSFRGFWSAEFPANGPFDEGAITIDGNDIIGTDDIFANPVPTGMLVTAGGVTVKNNNFSNVGTSVYEELCGTTNPNDIPTVYTGNTFVNVRTGFNLNVVGDCTGRTPDPSITYNTFTAGLVGADDRHPIGVGVGGLAPAPAISAPCNWWGSGDGPGALGGSLNARITPTVDAAPWQTTLGTCG